MSPRKPKYTELTAQVAALKHALKFYADPRRYRGSNQKPIEGDPYAYPNSVYIMDVLRDGGGIARTALVDVAKKTV